MGRKCEIVKGKDERNFAVVKEKLVIPGNLTCGYSYMGKEA